MTVAPTSAAPRTPTSGATSTSTSSASAAAGPRAGAHGSAGMAFARVLGRAVAAHGGKVALAGARGAKGEGAIGRGGLVGAHGGHGQAASESVAQHGRGEVRGRREEEEDGHGHGQAGAGEELLDPAVRQAAMLAPPVMVAPAVPSVVASEGGRARLSLEEIMPQLVRRIAWAGDKHKGTVRLEIGAGAYAGATLLVHAEEGRVRVEVSGAHAAELRARLDQRLRRHGLDVESVT